MTPRPELLTPARQEHRAQLCAALVEIGLRLTAGEVRAHHGSTIRPSEWSIKQWDDCKREHIFQEVLREEDRYQRVRRGLERLAKAHPNWGYHP